MTEKEKEKQALKKSLLGFDPDIWRLAKSQAALDGITITKFIEEAVENELKRCQEENGDDNTLANALLTAAPDMYKALKILTDCYVLNKEVENRNLLWDNAIRVLSKAGGPS